MTTQHPRAPAHAAMPKGEGGGGGGSSDGEGGGGDGEGGGGEGGGGRRREAGQYPGVPVAPGTLDRVVGSQQGQSLW